MLVEPMNRPAQTSATYVDRDPLAACAKAARGALSTNTERAMRSDLAIYAAWCEARAVRALPASAETLAAFVDAMAKERAPATVRRYVASIAAAHRAIGLEKTTRSDPVRRALQRLHRRKGRRQAQAEGLTAALRQRLLDATGDGLIDARNRALLAAAYDTLLRRGELVALQLTDIVEDADGAATVLVRRSKADAEGRGAMAYLAPDSMALVREWLERGGVTEGRLFRSLNRGALGEPARREPGPAHLQDDGRARGVARRSRRVHLRTQHPGRGGTGHGRRRDRHGGHPARGTMEDHRDGQPLRRAPPCAAKRGGAARASSASRVSARWRIIRCTRGRGCRCPNDKNRADGRLSTECYREPDRPPDAGPVRGRRGARTARGTGRGGRNRCQSSGLNREAARLRIAGSRPGGLRASGRRHRI